MTVVIPSPQPFTIQLPALPPQTLPPPGIALLYFDQVTGKLKAIDSTGTSVLVGVASNPGGVDTAVQFNDGGTFGGDADLLAFDKTSGSLSVAGDVDAVQSLSAGSSGDNGLSIAGETNGNAVSLSANQNGGTLDLESNGQLSLGSRTGSLVIWNVSSVPIITVTSNGRLSFFNASPIFKPAITGAKAGNTALASLITQGAALGLWTDSTT